MDNRALTLIACALLLPHSLALPLSGPARAEPRGEALVSALPPPIGLTERVPLHALSGTALDGLDPVTYFLPGGPKPGVPAHESVFRGAAWRFASAANRAAFEAGPERFLPRLGGNDPLALAEGRLAEGRADLYAVVGGRLYLFHDPASRARFTAAPETLAAAETAWEALRESLVDPGSGRGAPP